MNASWWWALPILVLPVLWHRRKREQDRMALLATARFLPAAQPRRLRSWRLEEVPLLLLRCLLLLALIALLADVTLAWRGDTVLVMPGVATPRVTTSADTAGFEQAQRIALPDRNAAAWLHAHEREFKPQARVLVLGDAAMPATLPRFRHQVELRAQAAAAALAAPAAAAAADDAIHVAVYSARAANWRRLFAAAGADPRYVVDDGAASGPRTGARAAPDLIVWELPQAPPAGLRAPLWWVGETPGKVPVFPELARAAALGALRYADSARGRLWTMDTWPLADADGARALLERYASLHLAPRPFTAPPQLLPADAGAPAGGAAHAADGALRGLLALALVVLFALERMVAHVRRR